MELVCKYYQCGFCKFGDKCRKHHIKEICLIKNCTLKTCMKRHPKAWKYFVTQKSCKFGESCSYKHEVHNNLYEISELKEKIVALEGSVEVLHEKLSDLTKGVANIKKDIPNKENVILHKCSHCEYTASSSTVLKCHISTKHRKNQNSTPEKS